MTAFLPVYGLAETVLLATGKVRAEGPLVRWIEPPRDPGQRRIIDSAPADEGASPVVSCGAIIPGHVLKIVDPGSRSEAPDQTVGEIWINGPCVSPGYWGKPASTEEVFGARLHDDDSERRFLRTGDLGFLKDGEVYVLGRIKEMVIVRGRNFYAQDIEEAACASDPRMGHDRTVAFGVESDGREALILVHELTRSDLRKNLGAALGERIRASILNLYEINLDEIVFIKPATLPRTSSGKLQRGKARNLYLEGGLAEVERWRPTARPSAAPAPASPLAVEPTRRSSSQLELWLRSEIARALNLDVEHVRADQGFAQLGLDSLGAIRLVARLSESLGIQIDASELYDAQTIADLALLLSGEQAANAPRRMITKGQADEPIAIVGMACRFPGERHNLAGFWDLLAEGRSAVSTAEGRSSFDALESELTNDLLETVRRGAFLSDIDRFDAEFFQIAPVEGVRMDPQQRLVLEVAWSALEHAGMDPKELQRRPVGVFIGISANDYAHLIAAEGTEGANLYSGAGNALSMAAGRLSYVLGLEGPAVAVDTACSSSLVALHQACAALRRGEAELALAGAVNAILRPDVTIAFARARMLSADGLCKTFDAAADGYVRGEGCGVLVLKRLADAERDGDPILAVIRGSAVNQDGASAGLTVPHGPAQERVIEEALARAGVGPEDVDYLEAHGTGTELGDPIEVRAAARAYGRGRDPARPLLIGSVKTNIGHLEAAAGVAGLIKATLALHYGVIPQHLNFTTPSPHIDWANLPVRVTSEPTALPQGLDRPWRAGVSSFGFSGTNAHVILESYGRPSAEGAGTLAARRRLVGLPTGAPAQAGRTERHEAVGPRAVRVLPLSGKTAGALRDLTGLWGAWVSQRREAAAGAPEGLWEILSDGAYTAGVGRSHFGHRAAIAFGDAQELAGRLAALAEADDLALATDALSGVATGTRAASSGAARIGFLYTGQGSQRIGMGRGLYETEPVFRATLDRCEAVISELRGASLLDVMFGRAGAAGSLDDTAWTQPALYALEAGLTALWASLGVRPSVVMGHSVGELAAAYAAGVYSLEDGLRFAAARGALMGALPTMGSDGGAMLAIFAPAERVRAALAAHPDLSLAADNGAHQVGSGPVAAIEALSGALSSAGVRFERLRTSHAFHSKLMDPILEDLERALDGVALSAPQATLISNVSGREVEASERLDGAYWRRHARAPVAFSRSVEALAERGVDLLIEIGPQGTLSSMAAMCWPGDAPRMTPSLARGKANDASSFAQAVAAAYAAGARIDFAALYAAEERAKTDIPTYPFQRQKYWVEPPRRRPDQGPAAALLGPCVEVVGAGQRIYPQRLGLDRQSWLGDHRVYETAVVPGVSYVAMALQAVNLPARIEQVSFVEPLFLSDDRRQERDLQLMLTPASGERPGRFEVVSRQSGPVNLQEWRQHATGDVAAHAHFAHALRRVDLAQLKEHARRLSHEDLDKLWARFGLRYGPSFAALTEAWIAPGVSLARIEVPPALQPHVGDEPIHATLLDACTRVTAELVNLMNGDTEEGVFWAPWKIDSVSLSRRAPKTFYAYCDEPGRLATDGASRQDTVLMLDEQGECFGALEGFTIRRAPRDAFLRALSASERVDELLYDVIWREVPLRAAETFSTGAFLLTGAVDGEGAAAVRAMLEKRGIDVIVGADADPNRLFSTVTQTLTERRAESLVGILFVARPGCEEASGVPWAVRELLGLVQAASASGLSLSAGLCVITTAGAATQSGEDVLPSSTSLWGFGRSVMAEEPGLRLRLIDIAAKTAAEISESGLAAALLDPTGEPQLALRGDALLAPRLERASRTRESDFAFSPDRSVLITGGLGALGLSAAEWLARRGVRHIVLVGRRAADAATAARIEELARETGVIIVAAQADVGRRAEVEALIARFATDGSQEAQWPPLNGVIHAAGVLDDGLATALNAERLARVFAPKAAAAAHLDAATRNRELAFFLLYSSLAATLGSPGQANYAAANAFLDGVAASRRAAGLPATSVAWGPWGGGGMAASPTSAANLKRQGFSPLAPERAHQALLTLLASGRASGVIVDADRRRMGEMTGASPPPMLSSLIAPAAGRDGDAALLRRLSASSPESYDEILIAFLQSEMQAVLGLPSPPDPKDSFFDLGMDSLMAVELRNRLERAFRGEVAFSNTVAFDYPDALSLSGYIARSLKESLGQGGDKANASGRGGEGAASNELDLLMRDLERVKALRPPRTSTMPCPHKPKHIFLTGGNGFLGRYLLRDLLANSDAQITCLVRAQNEEAGRKRLVDALHSISVEHPSESALSRLHIVLGELTQPGLGLSSEEARLLAQSCDTILHCAAAVNHWKPYGHLREANVLSVLPLLDIMAGGIPKALHFISSILVFDSINGLGCKEGDAFPDKAPSFSGYAMSKWCAEQVLMRARALGYAVNIYRPSLIIGDSGSGFYDISEDDFGVSYLKLALATGLLPRTELMAVVNVDEASRSIVAATLAGDALNRNFNLFGIDPLETAVVREAASAVGIALEEVDLATWYEAARAVVETRRDLTTALKTAEFIEHRLKAADGASTPSSDARHSIGEFEGAATDDEDPSPLSSNVSSARLVKTLVWLEERRTQIAREFSHLASSQD